MKKIVCIMALTCAIMGGAFAQQKPAEPVETPKEEINSAALDVFQLLKGFVASSEDFFGFNLSASYERLIAPHYSIGPDLDFYYASVNDTPTVYFSLAAEGRYYPVSANFEKFFLGATLGFNVLLVDGKAKAENGGFAGLITSLKAGYKLIASKNFFIEPSMSYVLSKSGSLSTPLGWQGGLRLGYIF